MMLLKGNIMRFVKHGEQARKSKAKKKRRGKKSLRKVPTSAHNKHNKRPRDSVSDSESANESDGGSDSQSSPDTGTSVWYICMCCEYLISGSMCIHCVFPRNISVIGEKTLSQHTPK